MNKLKRILVILENNPSQTVQDDGMLEGATRELVIVENLRHVCLLDLTADFGVTTIR